MVKTHCWAVAIKYPNGWDRFKMLNSTNKLKSLGLRDPGNWRELSLMKGSGWEPHHLRLPPTEVSSPSLGVFKQVQRATYGQGWVVRGSGRIHIWRRTVCSELQLLKYLSHDFCYTSTLSYDLVTVSAEEIYLKRKTVRIIWASLVVLLVKKKLRGVKRSERGSVFSDSLRPHGLSVEFSRPEYWSGKPFPSPGDLPNPGIEPRSPALQVDSLPAEP